MHNQSLPVVCSTLSTSRPRTSGCIPMAHTQFTLPRCTGYSQATPSSTSQSSEPKALVEGNPHLAVWHIPRSADWTRNMQLACCCQSATCHAPEPGRCDGAASFGVGSLLQCKVCTCWPLMVAAVLVGNLLATCHLIHPTRCTALITLCHHAPHVVTNMHAACLHPFTCTPAAVVCPHVRAAVVCCQVLAAEGSSAGGCGRLLQAELGYAAACQ